MLTFFKIVKLVDSNYNSSYHEPINMNPWDP